MWTAARAKPCGAPQAQECVGTRQVIEMAIGVARDGGVIGRVGAAQYSEVPMDFDIDAAYRTKYRRYGPSIIGGVVNPEARAATIKLVPR